MPEPGFPDCRHRVSVALDQATVHAGLDLRWQGLREEEEKAVIPALISMGNKRLTYKVMAQTCYTITRYSALQFLLYTALLCL